MAEYQADVGVLVVHGIGSQAEGSTLIDFVDPLIGHLREQFPPETPADPPRVLEIDCDEDTPTAHVAGPALNGRDQKWLVREAHWAEAFDAPGRSEVVSWLCGIAPWFVFFFITRLWRRLDARWTDVAIGVLSAALVVGAIVAELASAEPSISGVLVGVGVVIPLAIVKWRSGSRSLAPAVVACSILFVYPLAAVASVLLLLLSMLGLLPIPGAKKVRQLQVALATTIGDCYAVIGSQRREQAMRDVIRCSLDSLITSTRGAHGPHPPIVIVAHSLGAALVFRLLRWDWPSSLNGRRVTLLTYGSAIVPIHVLEARRRATSTGGVWRAIVSFVGLLSLLGLFVLMVRTVAGDAPPPWWWSLPLVGLAIATWLGWRDGVCLDSPVPLPSDVLEHHRTVAELEQDRGKEAADNTRSRPTGGIRARLAASTRCPERYFVPGLDADGRELRWVDLWAPWDPVPNGPLHLDRQRAIPPGTDGRYRSMKPTWSSSGAVLPESYMVANDHQPWTDHVVYTTNREDVTGRVAMEIASAGGLIDAPAMTRLEGGANVPGGDENGQLANARVERAREVRQHLGWRVFGGQAAAITLALVAIVVHRRQLPELGGWLIDSGPGPIRSLVSGVIDVVPEGARDFVAGGARDPALLYGIVVAIAALALLLVLLAMTVGVCQRMASSRFTGERDVQCKGIVRFATLAVLAVVIAVAVLLFVRPWDDPPERGPGHDVRIVVDGQPATGTVTFQPLGQAADEAIVLDVSASGERVRLLAGQRYVVTAEVPGAKECAASDDRRSITVSCIPQAEPIDVDR